MKLIRRNGKEYLLVVIYDDVDRAREIITAFMTSKLDKYI